MPTGPWATSEQLEWLKSQRVAFAQAQESKKLPAFWVDINREFFTCWPDQASEIETNSASGSNDDGNNKRRKKGQSSKRVFETTAEWVEERKKVCYVFIQQLTVLIDVSSKSIYGSITMVSIGVIVDREKSKQSRSHYRSHHHGFPRNYTCIPRSIIPHV
jgi:hypothetical protein